MKEASNEFFTTGEFAKKAGVTLRTLRYYDKIGLLVPSDHNELGHRLYSKEDFGKLQKILTLKFIGLSLEDIANIMKYDLDHKDFKKSLEIQKEIMKEKIKHIQSVIKAIDEAAYTLNSNKEMDWDKFINIISAINSDKNWTQQYENASNLEARIAIHEIFSTNEEGWMQWFFKQLKKELSINMLKYENPNKIVNKSDEFQTNSQDLKHKLNIKILELGCGDATLWNKNFKHIPLNWEITLTDFSEGMLKDAKKNLGENKHRFKYKIVDAENITFKDECFDVVIANHMLYHVPNVTKALKEINRVLKHNGILFSSTVGKNHMKEIRDIISEFHMYNLTSKSWERTDSFQLENGFNIVSKYFNMVELKRYKDNLKVTDPVYILDYIFSMPGNNKTNLCSKDLKKIYDYLEHEIEKKQNIYITKDTGYFKGRK